MERFHLVVSNGGTNSPSSHLSFTQRVLPGGRVELSRLGIWHECIAAQGPDPRPPRNFQVLVDEDRPFAFGQGNVAKSAG